MGVVLFIGAALFLASENGAFQVKSSPQGGQVAARTGYSAPDFSLAMLDGTHVKLSQYQGKPVLINFWATWCDPCKEEMPIIQNAAQKNLENLVVLGINDDEPQVDVSQFIKDYHLTFSILLDPGAKVTDAYQVLGLPTTIFIDKKGTVQAVQIGSMTAGQLNDYLGRIGVKQ
jgi:cytochrome c biogenesis protein CcmG, thiol:disulfide interchange protein DsbE